MKITKNPAYSNIHFAADHLPILAFWSTMSCFAYGLIGGPPMLLLVCLLAVVPAQIIARILRHKAQITQTRTKTLAAWILQHFSQVLFILALFLQLGITATLTPTALFVIGGLVCTVYILIETLKHEYKVKRYEKIKVRAPPIYFDTLNRAIALLICSTLITTLVSPPLIQYFSVSPADAILLQLGIAIGLFYALNTLAKITRQHQAKYLSFNNIIMRVLLIGAMSANFHFFFGLPVLTTLLIWAGLIALTVLLDAVFYYGPLKPFARTQLAKSLPPKALWFMLLLFPCCGFVLANQISIVWLPKTHFITTIIGLSLGTLAGLIFVFQLYKRLKNNHEAPKGNTFWRTTDDIILQTHKKHQKISDIALPIEKIRLITVLATCVALTYFTMVGQTINTIIWAPALTISIIIAFLFQKCVAESKPIGIPTLFGPAFVALPLLAINPHASIIGYMVALIINLLATCIPMSNVSVTDYLTAKELTQKAHKDPNHVDHLQMHPHVQCECYRLPHSKRTDPKGT